MTTFTHDSGTRHSTPRHTEATASQSLTTSTGFPAATILGYPRIGPRRELKKALESYWAGQISAAEFQEHTRELQLETARHLTAIGLQGAGAIPGDFSAYDHVLDTAALLGVLPGRFADLRSPDGQLGLDAYFTLARGDERRPPWEMTKWFDTNYHYLVPETGPSTSFSLSCDRLLESIRAVQDQGVDSRPYLVGPVTFLLLSKAEEDAPEDFRPLSKLPELLPIYAELLGELAKLGVSWVQLDEPGACADWDVPPAEILAAVEEAYRFLGNLKAPQERPRILVSTPYGTPEAALPLLARAPVEALHLDLVHGKLPEDLPALATELAGTTLVAGVVDGRNIWRNDLSASAVLLDQLRDAGIEVSVATSTSTFHIPHDVSAEDQLSPALRSWLAFADQKTEEVLTLARYLSDPEAVPDQFMASDSLIASRAEAQGVHRQEVRQRLDQLSAADFTRTDYAHRAAAQAARLELPELPTTTIGSFPQTTQLRTARARNARGELSPEDYRDVIQEEIRRVVRLQEDLGLDLLVHGEPERNDMVQYFAEQLTGFAVTRHGWVQSYGSRCTRPSILWGDVSREAPMTVEWSAFAQSLTSKPVKAMLTGPVTILAWSFVREDQPLSKTAYQVALALREEIADLEAASLNVIQVDEPALRELLPLRHSDRADYLDWAVAAFRLATSGAAETTQVHTHLCYSEFGAVIGAIDGLDADVTSIEAARSRMEVAADLDDYGFRRGVGPGVYDIHSPRVPSQAELAELLQTALTRIPARQLWVNPDCGLKTRDYPETEASLRNLVLAARQVRELDRS